MAFECHEETGDSLYKTSVVDFVDNPWDEEVAPTQIRSYDSFKGGVSHSDRNKETRLSVIPVSDSEFQKNKLPLADNSPSNFCRSITDLPPALVSEILLCLDAKDLGIVSCVSTLLHRLATDHHGWKDLYCERWGQPLGSIPLGLGSKEERSWKDLFVEREFRSKAFMGRFSIDVLYGHTEAVRSVFLLSSAKLIFTAGYDSIIRMWDMEDGLCISSSRTLGCTIRAVTADTGVLVAGGTDGFLQCWKAIEGLPHLFDLTGFQNQNSEFRLWEHEGPITCIALDPVRIYSGSWDMTVRIWDRSLLKCVKVLRHSDWVWGLVPRGFTVASTAGGDVYVWDIDRGELLTVIQNSHVGNTYSLARNQTGDLLFTGGEDGGIKMFQITSQDMEDDVAPIATWTPHTGPVHSLAFEFPWLVSASSDGKLSLIYVRKLLKPRRPSNLSKVKQSVSQSSMEVPQKMLHGFGRNLFSVDIGADRIVCGGEEGVVRVWNFSQALEIERRVQALRSIRLENRMRRRKVQIEMNSKGGRNAQCSVLAKKNQMNGNGSGIWHGRRSSSGKLKA